MTLTNFRELHNIRYQYLIPFDLYTSSARK